MLCMDDAFAAASVERQRSLEPFGTRAESSPALSLTRRTLINNPTVVRATAVPPRSRPLRRALSALTPVALAARVRSSHNFKLRSDDNDLRCHENAHHDNETARKHGREQRQWNENAYINEWSSAQSSPVLQVHVSVPRFAQDCFAWNDATSIETWAAIREAHVIQPPLLYMSEYGTRWDIDLFVLPHNAVRAELMDMVDILNAFARSGFNLTLGHIHDFGAWWRVFEDFLLAYFSLDDAVLLPWTCDSKTSAESAEHSAVQSATTARRTRVEHLANEVGNAFTLFRCKPSGEVLPLLYRALHTFLPRLLSYMAKQEQHVGRAPNPSTTYRAELRRRLFDSVLSSKQPLTNIFLLTRWAPEDTGVYKLLRTQIRGHMRLRLRAHIRHITATHLRIVDNFRKVHLHVLKEPSPIVMN